PYKGPAEALLDSVTGRINYLLAPLVPALPFIKDGKLLALGVTTSQRSAVLPEVPTIAEGGLVNYEYQDWWGLFAPAATPQPIVSKLGKETARILDLAEVKKPMLAQGEEAKPSTPEEFKSFVR